jgi:hypothetical protein
MFKLDISKYEDVDVIEKEYKYEIKKVINCNVYRIIKYKFIAPSCWYIYSIEFLDKEKYMTKPIYIII